MKGESCILYNFIVAEIEMRNGEQVCLIPNFYLKNYKYLMIRGFLFAIAVVLGILYAVPVELFHVALAIAVIALLFVIIDSVTNIITVAKKDFGKLISTMEISQQKVYIKKNLKFFYPVVGIAILLNAALFLVTWLYRQNVQVPEVLVSEVSYGLQWGMYTVEIMLLALVCVMYKSVLRQEKPVLEFCFCQDNYVNTNVKMNGVELRHLGSCIRVLNEKEERLFIEEEGVVLIYNENTKEFISYSSEGVTSIAFVKQDGSLFAELRFLNGRWARF